MKVKSWGFAPKKVYDYEKDKEYPERYPMNTDSLGIEVVGKHLSGNNWEEVSKEQIDSVVCLVKGLMKKYSLSKEEDLYVHEDVPYKTEGEGKTVYDAIINHL